MSDIVGLSLISMLVLLAAISSGGGRLGRRKRHGKPFARRLNRSVD